jgi:hypothetical protein
MLELNEFCCGINMETLFFITGLINNIFLIAIFAVRAKRIDLIYRFGWIYLLLAFPAVAGLCLAAYEDKAQYAIFWGLFIAFLLAEGLLDWVLKADFRSDWSKNWYFLVPYLLLYYAMNYGFIAMPWNNSPVKGIPMLVLFLVQLVINLKSHPTKKQADAAGR